MELEFDEMAVDTTLAQAYLEENRSFDEKNYRDVNAQAPCLSISDLHTSLKVLQSQLKKNKELIAQLEYLIRGVPIKDTLLQIDLINQQIILFLTVEKVEKHRKKCDVTMFSNAIIMMNDSPLLLLGHIVKVVSRNSPGNRVWLEYDDKTTIVCHVFSNLCHESQLPVFSRTIQTTLSHGILSTMTGTVGVVSECSDVDSAVDIFVTSSEHVPWRLRNILVQESVYQQFKNALSWKCKLNKQRQGTSADDVIDAFDFNGRVFLMDVVGNAAPAFRTVPIEAYRTRKELKSLLCKYRSHYLSLWANDIAEINEITYKTSIPIIWVNSFGDFGGPPEVSEALFYNEELTSKLNVKDLFELKESWLSLDLKTRYGTLCEVLDKCATIDESLKESCLQMKNDLQITNTNNAFIHVGKNYVCLSMQAPPNKIFQTGNSFFNLGLLTAVLHGNAFVLKTPPKAQILNILKTARIPVIWVDQNEKATSKAIVYECPYSDEDLKDATTSIKVIWTNSGTTFAN